MLELEASRRHLPFRTKKGSSESLGGTGVDGGWTWLATSVAAFMSKENMSLGMDVERWSGWMPMVSCVLGNFVPNSRGEGEISEQDGNAE